MRSLRHELFSTCAVLALPTAILLAFPRSAIEFKGMEAPSPGPASVAFVALSEDERAALLGAARTAWQTDAPIGQRMRTRLPLGELPEESEGPLLDVGLARRRPEGPEPVSYRPSPWCPSLRAPPPVRVEGKAEEKAPPAFSREDLLSIK
ncbi:MAG: hypothetical protein K6G91_14220 [Kiritimatiellae bacterium]|nr:hypothetical protein [Kiritimatiellia bacterium]